MSDLQEYPNAVPVYDGAAPHHKRAAGRRWLTVVLIVLIVLLAGAAIYLLRRKPKAPAPSPPAPVTVAVAARRDMPVRLTATGTVTALNAVDLKARVDGQLQKLNYVEGQEVASGTLLAQLDPRPLRATLQQAQATLQKDQATLVNLKLDAERYDKLATIGAGTTQNRDSSKAALAAQLGTLAADQAQVDTARLQLDYATIKAPFSGRLGLRQVDVGAMVHASDTTGLVTLTQIAPITVLFSVPQERLGELATQQRKAPLAVAVNDASGGQALATGQLVFIDSQVDASTAQIKLKAAFPNTDRALWPGQLVTAELLLRTDRNVVALPSRAIQNGQNGSFVFVLRPDHTVIARAVTAGTSAAGYTTIKAGVSAGETVVLDGQSRIADGKPVTATISKE